MTIHRVIIADVLNQLRISPISISQLTEVSTPSSCFPFYCLTFFLVFFFLTIPSFPFASVFFNRQTPHFSLPFNFLFSLYFLPKCISPPLLLVSLFYHTEKARAEREYVFNKLLTKKHNKSFDQPQPNHPLPYFTTDAT